MISHSYENCKNIYLECDLWEPEDEEVRQGYLKEYPYSKIVEGSFLEFEVMDKWLNIQKTLDKNFEYKEIYYRKLDYNYCMIEFFFNKKENQIKFEEMIPNFYGVSFDGKKFRSEGHDTYIDLD